MVPVIGVYIERRRWKNFRRRFNDIRNAPCMDYASLSGRLPDKDSGVYRFSGIFESINSDGALWIKSDDLTIQADLKGAKTYISQNTGAQDDSFQRIRWDRISSLTGDARVFVGGCLVNRDGRRIFSSVPETPLLIIFYEGSEDVLSAHAVSAGRHSSEYFNFLTPYGFILGAFSQIIIAIVYLARPAYILIFVSAFIAFFTPLLPWIPPGILFATLYRRLWFQARIYRSYRDMIIYGIHPDEPQSLAKSYNRKAYILEVVAWFFLLAGTCVNIFFIGLIFLQFNI